MNIYNNNSFKRNLWAISIILLMLIATIQLTTHAAHAQACGTGISSMEWGGSNGGHGSWSVFCPKPSSKYTSAIR